MIKLLSTVYKIKMNYIYYIFTSPKKRHYFVECFYGKEFSGYVKYLALDLLQNKNNTIYVVYSDEKLKQEILDYGFIPVKINTVKYYKYYYMSKVIISNLNLYKRLKKKKSQSFIQTWHGYPLKKMAIELEDKTEAKRQHIEFSKDMKKWDYLLTSSNMYTKLLNDSFRFTSNINLIDTTFSHHKFLIDNKDNKDLKNTILKKYNIRSDKKIILYCPTWNTTSDIDLDLLQKNTDYQIIIKPHTHDSSFKDFKNSKYVNVLHDCYDIYELLLISDFLISNYSSIIFDYLLISDNVIVYQNDYEDYIKNVGLKFDITEVISNNNICTNKDDLINLVNNFNGKANKKYINDNVLGYNSSDDLTKLLEELC